MITGLPADITEVQSSGHEVVPRISTRDPKGRGWTELNVITAQLDYAAPGVFPGRALTVEAMLEADGVQKPNRCTFNPSFESAYAGSAAGGATVTQDGSWAVDGTKSIRINPAAPTAGAVDGSNGCTNPSLEGGTLTGWISVSTSNYPVTLDTTAPISGTSSALSTRTATSPSGVAGAAALQLGNGTTYFPVTPGVPITASVDIKTELAGRRIRLFFQWFDAALTATSSAISVPVSSTVAGQTYRVAATETPIAGTVTARLRVEVSLAAGNATTGERVWYDRFRWGGSPTDTAYFDGDSPADSAHGYRWTGTAKASSSERYALTYNTSSAAYPTGAGDSSGTSLARLGMVKGETYTVSATIRLTAAQTGTLHSLARTIAILRRDVGGALSGYANSGAAPNEPGVHRLIVTFTVPTDIEDLAIRLMDGSGFTAEPVWWDALLVEQGITDGSWVGTIPNVTEPLDLTETDWLTAPLSPYGSWLKAEQIVTRMDGSKIIVPWGYFRVDALVVNALSATVTIEAGDASSQVDDRPFVTVASSRLGSAQMIKAKISSWISEVFPAGIVPWWSTLVDFGGLADKAYGGRGGFFLDEDRLTALSTLVAKLQSGARLVFPRTGSLAKLIVPGSDDAPGEAYVTAGENLVWAEYADRIDRADMFNETVVTYETGTKTVVQKRLLAQYVDAGEELAVTGPFGYSTRETVAVDIPAGTADPDQYAKDLAYDAIGRSMSAPRVVNVSCGPIYGLEQGDIVLLQPSLDVVAKQGILTGASIPLHAAGGNWQLELTMTDPLDAEWIPRYRYLPPEQETLDESIVWRVLKPVTTTDMDVGHGSGGTKKLWRGWTVDNSSRTVGGTSLTGTSNGSQVVMRTSTTAWSEGAAEHRYRGRVSITAPNGAIEARVGLDTSLHGMIWGPWTKFNRGKTKTVNVDTQLKITPSAITFGLRIETRGMRSGEQIRMNSAKVEKAFRRTT